MTSERHPLSRVASVTRESEHLPIDFRSGDSPIVTGDEDLLGRRDLAKAVADVVRTIDVDQGAVIGIMGRWGSGKTSLMNMVRELLTPEIPGILEFNPWLYADSESIATSLIAELRSLAHGLVKAASASGRPSKDARRIALADAATQLDRYLTASIAFHEVPVIGGFVRALKMTAKTLPDALGASPAVRRREAIDALRQLANVDERLVVFVDDVDRLSKEETRSLMMAIRLGAAFPNTVYVLGCDPEAVARHLGTTTAEGMQYLEKMINASVQVPNAPKEVLSKMLVAGLRRAAPEAAHAWEEGGPESRDAMEAIVNLLATARDVKRVLNSLPVATAMYQAWIAPLHLLLLETIRVLHPDLIERIRKHSQGLTLHWMALLGPSEAASDAIRRDVSRFMKRSTPGEAHIARAVALALFPDAYGLAVSGREPDSQKYQEGVDSYAALSFYFTQTLSPELLATRESQVALNALLGRSLSGFDSPLSPEGQRSLRHRIGLLDVSDRVLICAEYLPFRLAQKAEQDREAGGVQFLRLSDERYRRIDPCFMEEIYLQTLPELEVSILRSALETSDLGDAKRVWAHIEEQSTTGQLDAVQFRELGEVAWGRLVPVERIGPTFSDTAPLEFLSELISGSMREEFTRRFWATKALVDAMAANILTCRFPLDDGLACLPATRGSDQARSLSTAMKEASSQAVVKWDGVGALTTVIDHVIRGEQLGYFDRAHISETFDCAKQTLVDNAAKEYGDSNLDRILGQRNTRGIGVLLSKLQLTADDRVKMDTLLKERSVIADIVESRQLTDANKQELLGGKDALDTATAWVRRPRSTEVPWAAD